MSWFKRVFTEERDWDTVCQWWSVMAGAEEEEAIQPINEISDQAPRTEAALAGWADELDQLVQARPGRITP